MMSQRLWTKSRSFKRITMVAISTKKSWLTASRTLSHRSWTPLGVQSKRAWRKITTMMPHSRSALTDRLLSFRSPIRGALRSPYRKHHRPVMNTSQSNLMGMSRCFLLLIWFKTMLTPVASCIWAGMKIQTCWWRLGSKVAPLAHQNRTEILTCAPQLLLSCLSKSRRTRAQSVIQSLYWLIAIAVTTAWRMLNIAKMMRLS